MLCSFSSYARIMFMFWPPVYWPRSPKSTLAFSIGPQPGRLPLEELENARVLILVLNLNAAVLHGHIHTLVVLALLLGHLITNAAKVESEIP